MLRLCPCRSLADRACRAAIWGLRLRMWGPTRRRLRPPPSSWVWSRYLIILGKCLCLKLNGGRQMSRHDMTFNLFSQGKCYDTTRHLRFWFQNVVNFLYISGKISLENVNIPKNLKFRSKSPSLYYFHPPTKSHIKIAPISPILSRWGFRWGETCLRHVSSKRCFRGKCLDTTRH